MAGSLFADILPVMAEETDKPQRPAKPAPPPPMPGGQLVLIAVPFLAALAIVAYTAMQGHVKPKAARPDDDPAPPAASQPATQEQER